MKKSLLALVAFFVMAIQASAMSYEQARDQALFLTDKMAYELNLTDEQYEAAYEINLDYLMSINSYNDLYGAYWTQRNLDLSYILLDWQYRSYVDAMYFYRPLYWGDGYWHFRVYARYPHRDYFFFGRPDIYVTYCGGHSWRMNGGRSWYYGRRFDGPAPGGQGPHFGMRDGFDRGDFGRGVRMASNTNRTFGNGTRFGSQQQGTPNRAFGGGTRTYSFGSSNVASTPQRNRTSTNGTRSFGNSTRTFGSSTRTTATMHSTPSRSFGGTVSTSEPRRTFSPENSKSSTPSRSFGGSTSSMPTRSFGGSTSSSPAHSFGGGSSSSTRSFGGGSFGGGHANSGGGHFGNGRTR